MSRREEIIESLSLRQERFGRMSPSKSRESDEQSCRSWNIRKLGNNSMSQPAIIAISLGLKLVAMNSLWI